MFAARGVWSPGLAADRYTRSSPHGHRTAGTALRGAFRNRCWCGSRTSVGAVLRTERGLRRQIALTNRAGLSAVHIVHRQRLGQHLRSFAVHLLQEQHVHVLERPRARRRSVRAIDVLTRASSVPEMAPRGVFLRTTICRRGQDFRRTRCWAAATPARTRPKPGQPKQNGHQDLRSAHGSSSLASGRRLRLLPFAIPARRLGHQPSVRRLERARSRAWPETSVTAFSLALGPHPPTRACTPIPLPRIPRSWLGMAAQAPPFPPG